MAPAEEEARQIPEGQKTILQKAKNLGDFGAAF
jgi:hypothetical protein